MARALTSSGRTGRLGAAEADSDAGGAQTTPAGQLERSDVTGLKPLAALYVAWLVTSGGLLWMLARRSARQHRPHAAIPLVAAAITLICVGLVVQALAVSGGSPGSPLSLKPASRWADVLLLSFIVWPFTSCMAVAQLSHQFSLGAGAARWLSFAAGLLIALLCPFALLAAGCGLAGACF